MSRVEVRGGDIATVARDRVTVQHGADVAAVTAWRQGGLVFADTPLSEALLEVGRWYDLDVRVADNPTTAGHVTAVFTADAPIGQVLHALESALEIRFERQGRTVIAHRIAGR